MIGSEEITNFFNARKSVNKSSFAREAGISDRHLRRLISGRSTPRPELSAKFRELFNKYGYYV